MRGISFDRYKVVLDRARIANPSLERILSSVVWLAADKLRYAVAFLIGAWTARYLGPEGYGTLNYALAIIALLTVVTDFGLESVTVRNLVRDSRRSQELLGTVAAIRLGSAVLCYLLIVSLPLLFGWTGQAKTLLLILGLSLIGQPALSVRCWFSAELASKAIFAANSIAFALSAIARISLIVCQRPIIEFAVVSACEVGLVATYLVWRYHARGFSVFEWQFSLSLAKQLIRECWPLVLSGFAVIVYMRIDQIMLEKMVGTREVGMYSAAIKFSELWYLIPGVLAASLFPSIVRTRSRSETQYTTRLQQYLNLSSGLAYACIIAGTIGAPTLVRLCFGDQFRTAEAILMVHLWASVFVFQGMAREQFLVSEGLLKFSFAATACGALINVLLNFLLIPLWSGVGAAIATVVSYALSAFLSSFTTKSTRDFGMMQLRSLLMPFASPKLRN